MAILNHGSTIRTADGGQSTTTIVTASNIGSYAVASSATYYIGTTQNVFNRASGAQTLTGVSIDGNAATVTNGVYTTGAQTIGGTKTFSDGVVVNGATYYTFNKPTTNAYQTVALFGSTSSGLFLTTDSAIIGTGAYYNNGWIATATGGRYLNFSGTNFTFSSFSGATVGGTASFGTIAQLSDAGSFSATGDFRAPIFYDSGNTSYYLDPANSGTSLLVAGNVGIGTTSASRKLIVNGDAAFATNSGGLVLASFDSDTGNIRPSVANGSILISDDSGALGRGTEFLNGGGVIIQSLSGFTPLEVKSNSSTLLFVASGGNVGIGTTSPGYKLDVNGSLNSTTSYTGIMYDNDDTTYYSNPSALSRLNALNIGNQGALTGDTTYALGAYHNARYMVGLRYSSGGANYPWLVHDSWNGSAFIIHFNGVGDRFQFSEGGIGQAHADFRAPIFYDSNDTAYYVDPNSVSRLASLRVYSAFDTASSDVYANMRVMRNNATTDGMYIGYGNSGSTAALTRIFGGGATTGELSKYSTYTLEPGSFRSPIFYDSDNTGYYLDAASTSNLNILGVAGRAGIGGAGSRSTNGLTVGFTDNSTFAANTDVGDTDRMLSIVNESSTTNAMAVLGFRVNPNGGTTNAMLDMKYVQTGATNTSGLHYTFNHGGSFLDRFSILSSGNVGIGAIAPDTNLQVVGHVHVGNQTTFENTGGWNKTIYLDGAVHARMRILGSAFASGKNSATETSIWVDNSAAPYSGLDTNAGSFRINAGFTTMLNSARSPIFYDSDDTTYYLDPANTSLSLKTRGYITITNASAPQNLAMLNIGYNGSGETRAIDIQGGWSTNESKSITFTHASTSTNIVAQINAQHNSPGSRLRWGKLYHSGDSSTYTMELISESTTSAYLTVAGSVRSPIFYDSDNTSYYINAAGASSLNTLTMAGIITTVSSGTAINFSGQSDSFGYNATAGQGTYIKGTGSTYIYGGGVFYDGSAIRTLLHSNNYSGYSTFSGAVTSTYGNFTTPGLIMGDAQYGFYVVSGNVYYKSASGGVHYWRNIANNANTMSLDNSGTLNLAADVRAPIFYDSNNTAYYLDPASTSNLVGLTVANTITGSITGSSVFIASLGSGLNYDIDRTTKRSGLSHYSGYSTGTNRPTTYDYTLQVTDGGKGWEISMDWISTAGPSIYARSLRDCCQNWSSWVRVLDSVNYAYAYNMNQNVRTTDNVAFANVTGAIFYDAANTAYYVDPASSSVLNFVRGTNFYDGTGTYNVNLGSGNTEGRGLVAGYSGGSYGGIGYNVRHTTTGGSWIAPMADTSTYLLFSNGVYFYYAAGGTAGRTLSYSTIGSLTSAGIFTVSGDSRAPLFYDSNDTSYYVDPAGTSRVNTLYVANALADSASVNGRILLYGNLHIDAYNGNDIYCNYYSGRRFRTYRGAGTGTETFRADTDGIIYAFEQFRTPIIYDYNDTNYYVDPASTTRLNNLTVIGTMTFGTLAYTTESRRSKNSSNVDIETVTGLVSPSGPTFLEIRGFCPPTMYRTTGDRPAPYGLGFGNGSESGGIMPIGAGDNLQEIMLYGANSGPTTFTFKRQIWEGNAQDPSFSNYYGSSVFSINTGTGAVTASTDIRSPIYYDQNNTAYYIDAASTSNLVGLTVANTITGSISGNAGTATTLQTARNINGTSFNGSAAITTATWGTARTLTIGSTGKSVDGSANVSWSLAELGAAATNQTMFIGTTSVAINRSSASQTLTGVSIDGNSATTTLATKATRANGNFYIDDNYGNTVVGLYSANRYQGVFAMGDSYKLAADGTGVGTLYGIAWSHPNAGGVAANLSDHGALILLNGTYAAAISSSIRCTADMRTPIYYDSNDTAYYVNPNGTSRLSSLNVNEYYAIGWFRNSSSGNGLYNEATGQHFYSDSANYWNVASSASAQGIRFRTGGHNGTVRGYIYADTSNSIGLLDQNGNWKLRVVDGDYSLADGSSMRAQIFYDSNDTAYYVNPASNSVLNGLFVNSYNNLVNDFKDIYVYGDVNTYYVVLIQGEYQYSFGRYSVTRGYNWAGPDTWNNATHRGGLTLDFEWSGDTAWGGNDKAIRIIEFNESYSTMVGGLGYPVNGGVIIWLRGGGVNGALYRIRTPIGCNATVTAYDGVSATNHSTSTSFTAADSTVFSTRANTSNVNNEVNARYPVRGAALLYNENSLVVDTGGNTQTKSGIFASAASVRAPIFYDTDNTGYYVDPNSTSNLVGLTVANTITGSVSGNAVTAGGLAVHSARNNEANKIVRTDSNGYIQAGWINTTSGNEGTTAIDRVYASYDGYIRYYTPANFRTVLDVPTRAGSGASGSWGISVTGSSASCTGNAATVTNGVYTNTGNTLTGTNLFQSNLGTTSGSLSSPPLQAYATGTNAAFMSFHRGGNYAVNMGLDSDNVLRIGGWSASANRWELDMSGNNWVASSFRAPIFYDSNDTNYYVDAASTSNLLLVKTRNTFGERVAVTASASTTINTQYNLTELTMSASITTLTLSNIQSSGTVHMWTIVTVGNGTAYSITWPAAVKWPSGAGPNVTGTNTKRDIYQFVTYDGGTTIYAIIVAQNL